MKIINSLFLAVLACFIASVYSCSDNDDDGEIYPKTINYSELSLENNNIDAEQVCAPIEHTLYLINSDKELVPFIKEDDTNKFWNIDFSKYTLLIMSGISNSNIESLDKQLIQNSIKDYELNIKIDKGGFGSIEPWSITLLIPKVAKNIEINGKITYDEKSIPLLFDRENDFESNIIDLSMENNNITAKQLMIANENKLSVINSDEELMPFIRDKNTAQFWNIDFSKYTLLIIGGNTAVTIGDINIQFEYIADVSYIFNVSVSLGMGQSPESWIKAILVNKIPTNAKITGKIEHCRYSNCRDVGTISY